MVIKDIVNKTGRALVYFNLLGVPTDEIVHAVSDEFEPRFRGLKEVQTCSDDPGRVLIEDLSARVCSRIGRSLRYKSNRGTERENSEHSSALTMGIMFYILGIRNPGYKNFYDFLARGGSSQ